MLVSITVNFTKLFLGCVHGSCITAFQCNCEDGWEVRMIFNIFHNPFYHMYISFRDEIATFPNAVRVVIQILDSVM